VREEPFEVPVEGGALRGHRALADAAPALLLHGGAAVTDYTEGLAKELDGRFATIRYTQRGTPPSFGPPPYSIETHVADALAVLDHLGLDRAWAIGHSWGGHLALHLLSAHPERVLGVIGVDALGATPVFGELDANLRGSLSADEIARLDEIEARRGRGEVTEAELLERHRIVWPHFVADPARPPIHLLTGVGVQASIETNASLSDHLARGTLARTLPAARVPALLVHGELDPLPLRSATETAALIPGAEVAVIEGCGHFPWIECPGEVRSAVERWLV
jgi:proline iminopeptidase